MSTFPLHDVITESGTHQVFPQHHYFSIDCWP
jgi:hypothetical protein